jgi:hypothetical protein
VEKKILTLSHNKNEEFQEKNIFQNFFLKISTFFQKSFFTPDLEGKKKRKKFQNFQFLSKKIIFYT